MIQRRVGSCGRSLWGAPTPVLSMVIALSALPSAYGLLTNGSFGSGLSAWKSVGLVSASEGAAQLSEGSEVPVLYQGVSADGYVYELRFNFNLSGLSSAAGSGSVDVAQLVLYGGTEASTLTPDGAAEERVLVEVSSTGVTQVAPNASAVPNAALGEGWYSAVVDFSSDFPAIAVAATILNHNELVDSSFQVSDVVMAKVDRGRLANISNRGPVGTGANIMIPGFAIAGTTPKTLLIRGVGPTLGGFGVAGTIADPAIGLFPSGEFTSLQSNDNWEDAPDVETLKTAFGLVGAFDLTEGSGDAAMLVMDLAPGGYTVQVSGVNDGTGVALAEVYDLGALLDGPTEVVNISNRGFVGVNAEVQIPGFVIGGARGKKVLIRAVGPSLAVFGVGGTLPDPTLELFRQGEQGSFLSNDNWEDAPNAGQIKATGASVGAFPLIEGDEGRDAAVLIALPPGNYSAVARGKSGSTGVALVEVYMVTENQRPVAINDSVYVDTASANVLPNLEILGNDEDPDEDILMVGLYSQPEIGSVALNEDGELVYTAPIGFFGEAVFSYRASDGEYESVPATIALQVTPVNAVIWKGGASGNFTDPANWIGGEVPGENDPVWIAPAGDTTITIDADTTVGSIRAGGTGAKVTLRINGRTLTAAGGLDIQPGSTLELSSGTLNTTQDAVIRGRLIWSGGVMSGAGTTIIADGASASLNNTTLYLRDGRNLTNSGTLTQTANSQILADTAGATSTITNASSGQWTANLNPNNRMAYPNNASATLNFVNAGTLSKTGSGLNYLGYTNGTLNLTNTGSLDVDGGRLLVDSNGTNSVSGSLNRASGAILEFSGGTTTVAGGTELTGAGMLRVSKGTVILTDGYTIPLVEITGGNLVANGALSIGSLKQANGVLSGTADVTVSGTLEWNAGVMSGEGTTIIAEGASASLNSTTLYLRDGRNLTNNGTLTQTANSQILADTANATSIITNASSGQWTVNMNPNNRMAYPNNATATLNFVNAGTLSKTGSGLNYLGYTNGTLNLTNTGSLDVDGGRLLVDSKGTNSLSGSLNRASGGILEFFGGTTTVAGGTDLTGEGMLRVSKGTVTLIDGYTLPLVEITGGNLVANGALSIGTLKQTNGTLSGTADVTVSGTLEWSGGVMSGGGTSIIAEGASASLNNTTLYLRDGRALTNSGTLTQTANSQILVDTAGATSTITNASSGQWTANLNPNNRMAYPNNASATLNFVNAGTLSKTGSGLNYLGYTNGTFNLTNTGILAVDAGTMRIDGASAVLGASGTLRLTTDGSTKPLERPGGLTIGGTLEVVLADGYTPANGTMIRLIDYGARSGSFSTITPPQGRTVSETYQSDGLDVTIN